MRLLCMTFPPNKRAENATDGEQLLKVAEECGEFLAAAIHGEGDDIEECIDSMLAHDGWLDKQPEEAVMAAVAKVRRKGAERGDWEACDD